MINDEDEITVQHIDDDNNVVEESKQQETAAKKSPVIRENKWYKWMAIGGFSFLAIILLLVSIPHKKAVPVVKKEAHASSQDLQAPSLPSANSNLTITPKEITALKIADQQLQEVPSQAQIDREQQKLMRMAASSNVLSNTNNNNNVATTNASSNKVLGSGDQNSQFMNNVATPTAFEATRMAHPSTTLAQGNIIQATLETPIDSNLPGMVRAVTSQNVYSEDNSTVIVPRGTRLIGQYTNEVVQGQNRVFVVWQRLIRPDDIEIELNSPGTDSLGTAGFGADSIDHHFFQQFGTAILLSMIGAGAANVGVAAGDQFNSAAAYRTALAQSFNDTAQQNLKNTGVIAPTLHVNQGKKVSVFVAHDLDFHDALKGTTKANNGSLFEGKLS